MTVRVLEQKTSMSAKILLKIMFTFSNKKYKKFRQRAQIWHDLIFKDSTFHSNFKKSHMFRAKFVDKSMSPVLVVDDPWQNGENLKSLDIGP